MSEQHGVQCRKACFRGGALPQTESFKTSQSLQPPVWIPCARMEARETVQGADITKRVGRSTVVTETRRGGVSDGLACEFTELIAKLEQQIEVLYSSSLRATAHQLRQDKHQDKRRSLASIVIQTRVRTPK
jgi:hypothetical protein